MSRNSAGVGQVNLQNFELHRTGSDNAFGGLAADKLSEAARVVLDSSLIPTLIVESDGRIIHGNAASVALLRSDVAFHAVDGHLALHRAAENQALADAVQSAACDGTMGLLRFFSRPGEPSLLVRVTPTPWPNLVVIYIAELRQKLRLPPGWSRVAFGFTLTNATLAEALADGLSLAEFAELNGLPIGTVRTRLKKLLSFTGFSSQAALVASLLRGASIMPDVEVSVMERKVSGAKPRKPIPDMQIHPTK